MENDNFNNLNFLMQKLKNYLLLDDIYPNILKTTDYFNIVECNCNRYCSGWYNENVYIMEVRW